MLTITGNDVFDLSFGLIFLFGFGGWGIGILKGALRRFIR